MITEAQARAFLAELARQDPARVLLATLDELIWIATSPRLTQPSIGTLTLAMFNVLYDLEHSAAASSPHLRRALVPIPGGHRLAYACVTRVSLLYGGRLVENSAALYYSTYGGRVRVDRVEVEGVGPTPPLPGLEILTLPTVRGDLRRALEAAGWPVARGWTPPDNRGETTEVDDG